MLPFISAFFCADFLPDLTLSAALWVFSDRKNLVIIA